MMGVVDRLRLLVVAGREPWPLCHGGRLRLFHMLRELARQGCGTTLAVPAQPAGSESEPATLPEGVDRITIPRRQNASTGAAARLHGARSFLGYSSDVGAWLRANATSRQFDAAFLSGMNRGVYTADIALPCVWDVVDDPVLHILRDVRNLVHRWPGAMRRATAFALAARECGRATRSIVVASSSDAACMRRYVGNTPVETVTNGVDADAFSPARPRGDDGTIAFIGSLSFPPNIDAITWFTKRVWPALRRGDATRRLLIVGKQPVAAVRSLAGVAGVELAADVPDVRPFLDRASVVVVPMRKGGGVKNKILEACAAGRPVVASPVAVAGLSARDGHELLIAHSPAAWLASVESLLSDRLRSDSFAAAGRAWVLREHDWSECGRRILEIVDSAVGAERASVKPAQETPIGSKPCVAESPCP